MQLNCGFGAPGGCYSGGGPVGVSASTDPAFCAAIGPGAHPASFWVSGGWESVGLVAGLDAIGEDEITEAGWHEVTGTLVAPAGTESALFSLRISSLFDCDDYCWIGANFDDVDVEDTVVSDTTPPETTITSGPSGTTGSNSATFEFAADEPATFKCGLDTAPLEVCSSPVSYGDLNDGPHTFRVRATDTTGNADPTPAERMWTVETTPPQTTITSGPSGTTHDTWAWFDFIASEPSTFECSLDDAQFAACYSPTGYDGLGEGAHTFRVRAVDGSGNPDPTPAEQSWTVDRTPPETTITSGPSGTTEATSATFEFSASEPSAFLCSLDNNLWTDCTSPKTYTGLADGPHNVRIQAHDAVGNYDPTPATRTWTVNTSPPETTITSGPSGTTTSTSATFEFTASEPATFECKLDTDAFAACTSPKAYTGLGDGSHTLRVQATDAAGNTDPTPAERTWTVAPPPPPPPSASCIGGAVTIRDDTTASPYPSTCVVSGLSGTITDVDLQLTGLSHTYPDDIDILLVSPGGQNAIVMSDAGSGLDVTNVNLTLDDEAAGQPPDLKQIVSGSYRPANWPRMADPFPGPAPARSGAVALSTFDGGQANGTWALYVVDDEAVDVGSLAGWSLKITTLPG
jgi:subtilisin-like proprotein convertase family protein